MPINITKLFAITNQIYDVWKKIPRTEILNQEVTINVPESTIDYTIALKIPSTLRSLRKPVEFDAPSINQITVMSFPVFRTIPDAIQKRTYENGKTCFFLHPRLLPNDTVYISLSVSYKIDEPAFVDALVDRQTAHEPSGAEKNEYWMSAQLKHPKILQESLKFSRFDLRDVDVTVDVGVHNELKTSLPPSFIKRLKVIHDIMAEIDPRRQYLAVPQLRKLATEKTSGREFEILGELESLFLPLTFSKYLDVRQDFRYTDCYKSKEFFELPMDVLPKRMNVISRASLTLDQPTAQGTLLYKNNQIIDAIKNIIKV